METWNELLGDVMLKKGNADEALTYYTKAIEVNRELGNPVTEAIHIGSLGDVHMHKGELDQAFQYYQQALSILKESERIGEYYDLQLQMAKILTNPESATYDLSHAENILVASLEILQALSLKSTEQEYHNDLSNIYKTQGNWENAYHHYVASMNIKQELSSNEVREKIKDMEFRQAYQQMEQERLLEITRLQEKEQLLHEILPSHVAERIIQGEKTIAEESPDMTKIGRAHV